jgi:predicted site-specific integrase-resolvase
MKKLAHYAKQHNVTYHTAWNHFHAGLIENAYQLPNGTIVIPDSTQLKPKQQDYTITYARVSSSENKDNLERQSERLTQFCNAKGITVQEEVKEIGSGLNDQRKKLNKILTEGKATKIVVEHKDRLTRFGFEYIKQTCDKFNCEIVVLNETEEKQDRLVEDFVSVITSFCAKIYGQRRSKRNTERLIKELQNDS